MWKVNIYATMKQVIKQRGKDIYDWKSVIAYNIRRALGIEAADEAEIRLGEDLIPRAIKEFENYQEKVNLIQK